MKHDADLARQKLRDGGLSNEAIAKLEDGQTWHHVKGGQSMELVPSDLHAAYYHIGGSADIKKSNRLLRAIAGVAAFFNPFANTTEALAGDGGIGSAVVQDGVGLVAQPIDIAASAAQMGRAAGEYMNHEVNKSLRPGWGHKMLRGTDPNSPAGQMLLEAYPEWNN